MAIFFILALAAIFLCIYLFIIQYDDCSQLPSHQIYAQNVFKNQAVFGKAQIIFSTFKDHNLFIRMVGGTQFGEDSQIFIWNFILLTAHLCVYVTGN